MKKLVFLACLIIFLPFAAFVDAAMVGLEAHQKYLYPVVRIQDAKGGGSGTVVYSKINKDQKYSTYVLTNHHVVATSIEIGEEWNSSIGKNVKRERKHLVYIEIFRYKDMSTPIGAMRIEADIIIYSKERDTAILKLRLDEPIHNVAILPDKTASDNYRVFDEVVAVGCSLGLPALPTIGIITRLNQQLGGNRYHMASAPIIFGNSGGALYLATTGELIGIPSAGAIVPIGWGGSAITHIHFFIPIAEVYTWLADEYYDFLFDDSKNEYDCIQIRKMEIEKKQQSGN